jgi:hypothetical protein
MVLGRVETLRLASRRGLLGPYDVLDRNCEHLINWCVAGDLDSVQVRKLWFGGGSVLSVVAAGYVTAVSRGTAKRPAPPPHARRRLQPHQNRSHGTDSSSDLDTLGRAR